MIEALQVRFGTGQVAEAEWWVAFWRVVPTWILLAALSPMAIWASDRWPVRGRQWSRSLFRHLVLALPFALAHLALTALWASVRPASFELSFSQGMGWLVSGYLVYSMLSYGALVGVVHAFRYHREAEKNRTDSEALVADLERARHRALEGKLHPHFVFNTLNAITGLASRGDQKGVVSTLEAFSDLLQATLDDRVMEPVPLQEELELLRRYVEIQQVRFGSRLQVEWEIEEVVLGDDVPGLLLQPLVENALSHAIERSRKGGTVTVRARRVTGGLEVEVEDTGPGPEGQSPARYHTGRGIGLDSTRARLTSLYGDAARLELDRAETGTVARVFIPRGRNIAPW